MPLPGAHDVGSLGDGDGRPHAQHPSPGPGALLPRGDWDAPRSRPGGPPAHVGEGTHKTTSRTQGSAGSLLGGDERNEGKQDTLELVIEVREVGAGKAQ